jgi:glyoxylase-like metal-dependent hydrolase (beta-lactamase superfamily II)
LALEDGQTLSFGPYQIRVITTPGHTNSCVSYYAEGRVFTGDVLFVRDVGRTDFQEGSNEKMWESITQKLFRLPPETLVYPAHDYRGHTVSTIAEERAFNPKVGGDTRFEDFAARMAALKLGPPKRLHIAVPANLRGGAVS